MSSIIKALNGLLAWELTSIDQYTQHSEFYEDWGFSKLHARIAHEADDERGHAKMLIERILLLGGKPDMETRHPLPDATALYLVLLLTSRGLSGTDHVDGKEPGT